MHDEPDLLTPGELRERIGLKWTQFCHYQKLGKYDHLKVTRPIGKRKYSRELVDKFMAGESTVKLGKGSRRPA
jgi:hypothetical protein